MCLFVCCFACFASRVAWARQSLFLLQVYCILLLWFRFCHFIKWVYFFLAPPLLVSTLWLGIKKKKLRKKERKKTKWKKIFTKFCSSFRPIYWRRQQINKKRSSTNFKIVSDQNLVFVVSDFWLSRVVNGPTSWGPNPARTRKCKPKPEN